jgi:hypothetical protein
MIIRVLCGIGAAISLFGALLYLGDGRGYFFGLFCLVVGVLLAVLAVKGGRSRS